VLLTVHCVVFGGVNSLRSRPGEVRDRRGWHGRPGRRNTRSGKINILHEKQDIRSSVMLRSVAWYLVTDVSGRPIGPIFKGQAVQEECRGTF
jgi:hypothetical protein